MKTSCWDCFHNSKKIILEIALFKIIPKKESAFLDTLFAIIHSRVKAALDHYYYFLINFLITEDVSFFTRIK